MKKTLLLLFYIVLLSSCEKESLVSPMDDIFETEKVEKDSKYVSYFKDMVFDKENHSSELKPRKQMNEVKIWLHSSVPQSHKEWLTDLINEINTVIPSDELKFNYVSTQDSATVSIIFVGSGNYGLYPEVFEGVTLNVDYIERNNIWGQASNWLYSEEECQRLQSRIWYSNNGGSYTEAILKHEFLHSLGLKHYDGYEYEGSIMTRYITSGAEDITENDKMVLKLLYYNGEYGEVSENIDCGDPYIDSEQKEKVLNLVEVLLDNM